MCTMASAVTVPNLLLARARGLMEKVMLFLELGRVRFLVYSPIAFAVGVTCATISSSIDNIDHNHSNIANPAAGFTISVPLFLLGQLFVSCTHMLTHFFNEYYDYEADQLHEFPSPWTGGSRVLVSGRVLPMTSFYLGCALSVVSLGLCAGIPGVDAGTRLVMLVILIFSIGYSAPPLKLIARGLGEADVMLVLNLLVPLFGYMLFRNEEDYGSSPCLLWGVIPAALVEFVRMMVMNMADVVGDAQAGKLTLVVRLGLRRSAAWHMAGMVGAYASLSVLFLQSGKECNMVPVASFLLQMCTLPMAARICYRLYFREEYLSVVRSYNLPYVATQHHGFMLVLGLVGLVWSDEQRPIWSRLSVLRMLGVYYFLAQFTWRTWKGWCNGNLGNVFNPKVSDADVAQKSKQIAYWDEALARAAQPFFTHNATK